MRLREKTAALFPHLPEPSSPQEETFSCIDLFAGAGGLAEGFRQARFDIRVATDFDEQCAATYKAANPEETYLCAPIEKLDAAALRLAAGMGKGELDCLIGGPPCQAFSVYNHQRGFHDERSGLFREYLRLVTDLKPATIVMENVTGITSVDEGRAVDEIHKKLSDLGYWVDHKVLKAEEYGVPQERRRIFFLGSRIGEIKWPTPTHGPLSPSKREFTTVWDAISDLPKVGINEGVEVRRYSGPAETTFQRSMRRGTRHLCNHIGPYLAAINLERMKHIPPGGSWRDIPHHLLPAGMKLARRCDHTKRYGRLEKDGLACTILTKCDPHWGAYLHPTQDRSLTVREAARLQSFPDRICFLGPRVEQYRQVGNAVPPLLARAVAREVGEVLQASTKKHGRSAIAR